ncbi:MAG: hypothetical protein ACOCXA_05555, partial [Planctomycetota bacterium]
RDLAGEVEASRRRSFFIRLQLVDIGANPGETVSTEEIASYFRLDDQPRPEDLPEELDWDPPDTEAIIWHLRDRKLLHQWDAVVARRDALALETR